MPHRTTVIELSIRPSELFATIQNWARDSGFSLQGKSGNRTFYTKNILGAKGWVAVESTEDRARIEVWQSSTRVGPDFDGNLWVGWKVPLPGGLVVGPNGVYKKQVHTLFELLAGKSIDPPLSEGNAQGKRRPSTLDPSVLTRGLMFFGVFTIAAGALTLLSAASLLSQPSFSSLVQSMWMEGTSDVIFGALIVASSRAIVKGRMLGIWLYAASILADYVYRLALGEPMNYLFIGLSLLFIWQLLGSRKKWRLT